MVDEFNEKSKTLSLSLFIFLIKQCPSKQVVLPASHEPESFRGNIHAS